jgi:FkbM family methyltransferase
MLEAIVASITRCYPLLSGRGAIANSRLLKALTGSPNELRWAPVPGGQLRVPLNDLVGRAAYFMRDLDPKITLACRRYLRPGDTALDIGANMGLVTVLLSSIVGPSGHIHAFEPQSSLVDLLRQSLARNERHNVTIHPVALGTHDGEMTLSLSGTNSGAASLVRHVGGSVASVQVRTLSGLLGETKARLVKLDVEGYEADVLEGGRAWLEAAKPDVILFESNDDDDRVFRILERFGYRFFGIPKTLVSLKLDPYKLGARKTANDFVALQPHVPL